MALKRWLWGLAGLTFFLIVWGGVVRRSGSGLGCPDWPLCYGQVVPPSEPAAWVEFTHRLLAGLVGLLTLGLTCVTWCKVELRRNFGWWTLGALGLVLAQAVLGGVTVKTELHPLIVAAHLALAFAFFGVVIGMQAKTSYSVFRIPYSVQNKRTGGHDQQLKMDDGIRTTVYGRRTTVLGWLALITLFCQVVVGGLVSGYQAGLVCPDFPTCQGQWWPPFVGLVGLHMTHRLGAVVTVLLVGGTAWVVRRRPAARFLLLLLALQIALGIGNVLLGLPFGVDVAHLAVATALFGALIVCVRQCNLPPTSH